MAVAAFQIRFEEVSTFQQEMKQQARSCWNRCVKTYHQHSDMISSLGLFTLNTTILASKIFEQIPKVIPRSCYVALNFTGLIWMNMRIRDLIKNGEDLYQSILAKDMEGIVFTAAKVTVKALNILLTGAMLAAALISLAGFPRIPLSMYALMQPFALFSLLVGIGTDVYDYKKNEALARQFSSIENEDKKVQNVMDNFLKQLQSVKNPTPESDAKRLARHTFRQLDHFTLEQMKDELSMEISSDKKRDLFLALKQALHHKQQFTQANLGLVALGYLSMAVCRIWPETMIQSSVTWGMSLLYTSKKVWEKHLQCQWQKQVH